MTNTVRIAIEVSRYMRRVMRELFRDGAGLPIEAVSYLVEEEDASGVVDELAIDSDAWQWANAVLMLLRALHGILENAEEEITEL